MRKARIDRLCALCAIAVGLAVGCGAGDGADSAAPGGGAGGDASGIDSGTDGRASDGAADARDSSVVDGHADAADARGDVPDAPADAPDAADHDGGTTTKGHSGAELVSAGQVGRSASYEMVFTLGQPSPAQGTHGSPSYRLRGGIVGATGGVP